MKLIALIATFFLLNTATAKAQEFDLIGTWENSQYQIVYEFGEDNRLFFSQMGYGVAASYTIDDSVTPTRMNMVMSQGGQEITIPALVQFKDNKTVVIEQFTPYSEPTAFSPDDASRVTKYILTLKE